MEQSPATPVRVHKFGGTSVADAGRLRAAARLAAQDRDQHPDARTVVVTSALGGVTDRLLAAIHAARDRTGEHRSILEEIEQRHRDAAAELESGEERLDAIRAVIEEVEELLQGIFLLRECTPRFTDAIVSAGERLAAPLLAAAIRAEGLEAEDLDARRLIRTDDAFGEAAVDFGATRRLVREAFEGIPPDAVTVVTGYIASTEDGVTTTLGRSGSDYTATLLAAALDAEHVIIWTDVDGVLSADPRIVPEAYTLPHLTYREAAELAHFGARVLHPRTMRPLERAGIPLVTKNTGNPSASGTRIDDTAPAGGPPVKAVTAVREAALVTLDGAGIIGVPNLTARAFEALAHRDVPVLMIAQASSEGSLCLAVYERDADSAVRTLERALENECARGDLRGIRSEKGLSVVAAVGEGLRRQPGLAGRMFATLARARVNVSAIAQGASDHNLSCVVDDADAERAVQALHETFALGRLRAHLVVVGTGSIGSRFLKLLGERAGPLLASQRLNLRLAGVADSRRLLWHADGLDPATAAARLAQAVPSTADPLAALTDHLRSARVERLIVVDASPAEAVARSYPEWLREGAAVVTPNQRAFTLDEELYQAVRAAASGAATPIAYDTTVGAGLSILSTLRDLRRTGDTVRRIEGVLSGTLAYVFSALREGRPFAEAVRQAAERGLTETDPRADLAGEDVARKLVILARELDLPIDPAGVKVQSLVPPELRDLSVDEFWQRLPAVDAFWQRKGEEFASRGQRLQYVAVLGPDLVRAGVQGLPDGSPLAGLRGSSVAFAFHTERYQREPLVVQGPGASADITAAVLLADVVRAAEAMR